MNEQKIQTPQAGKPIELSWGKAITEKANSLNIVGGNGITVSQNGNGITISQIDKQGTKQAIPYLFECRWRVVGGQTQLFAYIGKNNAHTIVYRNSKPCQATTISDSDGWAMVGGVPPSPEYSTYVYVKISPTTVTGGVAYTWDLMATDEFIGTADLAGDPERIAGASYVYIASYVDGVLRQWHVGEISTWYIYPDSQYPYNIGGFESKSLDHVGTEAGLDIYQLYEFRNTDNQMDVAAMSDTAILDTDTADGDKYKGLDFLVREWNAGTKAHLRYAAIEDVLAALGEVLLYYKPVEPTSGTPYDHPFYGWETWIAEHILEYTGGGDIDIDYWVTYILNESDNKYWHQGGNQNNCYGESIGDPAGNLAIDLVGRSLLRDAGNKTVDWEAMELWSNKLSIAWEDRLMWDHSEKKSIDWSSRLLHDDAGIKTLDWNNCQAFASYNGWVSIDWEAAQLYSHVFEYGPPVKSLDWNACTTYDAAGNITMSWRTRKLMGGWSIAAGGSFSTPNLTLNGTTFTGATQMSVITAIDFATSATSSANIWVLST